MYMTYKYSIRAVVAYFAIKIKLRRSHSSGPIEHVIRIYSINPLKVIGIILVTYFPIFNMPILFGEN